MAGRVIKPFPAPRFYRGRKQELGWVEGQLVYLDNIPFLLYLSNSTGLTFVAVDQLEGLEEIS